MTLKSILPAAAVCSLVVGGLSNVRAQDHQGTGHQMGGQQGGMGGSTTKPSGGGHDMGSMSHDQMMQDCHAHAMKAQEHLDKANQSAAADDMEKTKQHLAMAKQEMDECMKMMMGAMEKKQGQQQSSMPGETGAAGGTFTTPR